MNEEKPIGTVLEVDKVNKTEAIPERPKVYIDQKDYSWLKKNRYEQESKKHNTTYVLQHLKYKDKVVELKATSPFHACQMIHWKPNQVRVIQEIHGQCEDVMDKVKKISFNLVKSSISGSSSII